MYRIVQLGDLNEFRVEEYKQGMFSSGWKTARRRIDALGDCWQELCEYGSREKAEEVRRKLEAEAVNARKRKTAKWHDMNAVDERKRQEKYIADLQGQVRTAEFKAQTIMAAYQEYQANIQHRLNAFDTALEAERKAVKTEMDRLTKQLRAEEGMSQHYAVTCDQLRAQLDDALAKLRRRRR